MKQGALQGSDALASGSTEIDSQHKELSARVNGLLAACEKGSTGRQETGKIAAYLTDYVVFHFGAEEKHRDQFKYSIATQHKARMRSS